VRDKLTIDTVRFLDLIKPFTPLLPEVASPETKVPFQQVRHSENANGATAANWHRN
jgi:hypothetical protein